MSTVHPYPPSAIATSPTPTSRMTPTCSARTASARVAESSLSMVPICWRRMVRRGWPAWRRPPIRSALDQDRGGASGWSQSADSPQAAGGHDHGAEHGKGSLGDGLDRLAASSPDRPRAAVIMIVVQNMGETVVWTVSNFPQPV